MANHEVTLKRYNASNSTAEVLYPTTTMGQVQVSDADSTTITQFLVNNYVNLNQKGAANGVATLDANQKLTYSQIPSGLIGGLKFIGALSANTELDALVEAQSFGTEAQALGSYWIATANITISTGGESTVLAPGDEGDSTLPIDIEAGDWIVLTSFASNDYEFAIVNNTYQDASATAKGIVTLSNQTTTEGTTSKVITESVLKGLIETDVDMSGSDGAGAGIGANLISPAAHNHDNRYYTETEIATFFNTNGSFTEYLPNNWDAAYNDKINSAAFDTSTGVVTLTQQDGGTVTVDIDGRYAEDVIAGNGIDVSKTGQAYTVSHEDTSSVADVDNSNGTVIQDLTFDTYGHVQTHQSVDLDTRYYTETEFNNWFDGTALDGHYFTEIKYGATPTATVEGTILIVLD